MNHEIQKSQEYAVRSSKKAFKQKKIRVFKDEDITNSKFYEMVFGFQLNMSCLPYCMISFRGYMYKSLRSKKIIFS